MGSYTDALYILEHNGGIELEDIREGEGSIQELWEEVTEIVHGTATAVPYIYIVNDIRNFVFGLAGASVYGSCKRRKQKFVMSFTIISGQANQRPRCLPAIKLKEAEPVPGNVRAI